MAWQALLLRLLHLWHNADALDGVKKASAASTEYPLDNLQDNGNSTFNIAIVFLFTCVAILLAKHFCRRMGQYSYCAYSTQPILTDFWVTFKTWVFIVGSTLLGLPFWVPLLV